MVKQIGKAKQLKAFLVTFSFENEEDLHNVVIISHNKEEAGDIFAMYAHGKNLYNKINAICVQAMRKTKRNAHMISEEFYNRQNAYVNDIFEKVNVK